MKAFSHRHSTSISGFVITSGSALVLLWSHLERSWVLGSSGRMGWGALSTVSSECPWGNWEELSCSALG